jgi:hypothetical protein
MFGSILADFFTNFFGHPGKDPRANRHKTILVGKRNQSLLRPVTKHKFIMLEEKSDQIV